MLLHPAGEVTDVDTFDRLLPGRMDVPRRWKRFGDALFIDRPFDVALRVHFAQHEVAPRARGDGMRDGVIGGRRGDHTRQQRGLPGGQLFHAQLLAGHAAAEVVDVLAEVRLCGGLDPVGAVAEVDRVEVGREDLFLGPLV